MKGSDRVVPVLIAAVVILVAVFCVFILELPQEEPAGTSGNTLVKGSGAGETNLTSTTLFQMMMMAAELNESRWVSTTDTDNARLVVLIKQNALPLNNLATICMVHLNNNNAAELVSQAEVLEKTAIAAWDKTDTLNVSPGEYTLMYNGYRSALTEYMIAASALKAGMPKTADEKKMAFGRLVSASNRMITAYNDIDFEVEYPDDVVSQVRGIEVVEPEPDPVEVTEPLVISDALSRGTSHEYKDSRLNNLIRVTVPIDSGRFIRSFYYTDKTTQKGVTMTAPEDKMYYMVAVSYTHAGHLDGNTMTITPPTAASHTLQYEDVTLKPVSITNAIGNALNVGLAYNTNAIERLEKKDMLLFYEVPTNFTKENAYLTVNLGSTWGTPSWKLW